MSQDNRENPSPAPATLPTSIQVAAPRQQNPALAIAPRDMDPDEKMAWYMVQSGCCDTRLLAQAIVKIRFGQTMGLDPYTAVTGLYVNSKNGKLSPSANLLAALIRKSRTYDYKIIEKTNTRCILRFFRQVAGQWEAQTPDEIADIKDFQHLVKEGGPWKLYPKNMLFSRAITNGQKAHCPDVTNGAALYTPDELPGGPEIDGETLEVKVTSISPPLSSTFVTSANESPELVLLQDLLQETGKDLTWLSTTLGVPLSSPGELTPGQIRHATRLLTNLKQEG